ncbi:maltose O-acetyltransferase [Vibrio ishigakensis]|uniref:Acetyltransferase n=1 Tax=Vibrio ishigakensis TaxID=1481914 RepID=A0A0B8NK50_9VIBR|nr:sugar O-acetyltransferase [Vibrio ishigakensis]GAM55090.1 maltose O-acetyltransferase [Vibrio ishigakensis]
MKTEKEKMLAGEAYLASDKELFEEHTRCRELLMKLNQSTRHSDTWKSAIESLLPNRVDIPQINPPFYCDYGSNIIFGKNFYANYNCTVLDVNTVEFGDNVMLAPNVQIYTAGHPLDVKQRVEEGVEFGLPIKIGHNVWIGGGAIICPGVSIGDNTVIGAGSVVTKDIPGNVLAAGNPCRVLRELNN